MVRRIRSILVLGGVLAVAACLWPASAQISISGTSGIGPFTQAQVESGRAAYNAACSACHGYNLENGTHRTSLIGRSFMAGWGGRSTIEYYRYVSYRMPYRDPGSLTPEAYASIVAYILAANGAQPGAETLTALTAVKINTITDGIVRDTVLAGNSQPQ